MTDLEARYDRIADFYESTIGDRLTDEGTAALLELVGGVGGERVLDLACGHGRISRELARRGGRVVGVDLSQALLEKARLAGSAPPGTVDYRLGSAADPQLELGQTFDTVVCNYGLTDIDDLAGTLANVTRVLRPGGRFVYSMLHPCFPGWGPDAPSSWPVDGGYYREGWWLGTNPGFRGKVGANHRMLSTYLNLLTEQGLVLDRVVEPRPGPDWEQRLPGGTPVPVFLAVRCIRR